MLIHIYIYHYISLRGLWGQLQFFGKVSGLPQSLTEIGSWFGDVWNSLNWQWVGPPCQLVVRTKQLTINCTMYKSETPNGGRRLATPEKWFSSYLKSKIPNSNAPGPFTKSEKKKLPKFRTVNECKPDHMGMIEISAIKLLMTYSRGWFMAARCYSFTILNPIQTI